MTKPKNVPAAAAASAVALTSEDRSGIRAPLLANSYEFSELDTAVQAAIDKAADADGDVAPDLHAVVHEQAQLQDVLEAQALPSVPEGSELAEIRTQGGQVVHAPVGIVAEGAKSGEEAAAMTPPPPPPPPGGGDAGKDGGGKSDAAGKGGDDAGGAKA